MLPSEQDQVVASEDGAAVVEAEADPQASQAEMICKRPDGTGIMVVVVVVVVAVEGRSTIWYLMSMIVGATVRRGGGRGRGRRGGRGMDRASEIETGTEETESTTDDVMMAGRGIMDDADVCRCSLRL